MTDRGARPAAGLRGAGAVRRTTRLEMVRDGGRLQVRGATRDVRTGAGGTVPAGPPAGVTVLLDAGRNVVSITSEPSCADLRQLVGRPAASGFRAAAAAALGPTDPSGRLAVLLDDVPVAALISGYADALAAADEAGPPTPATTAHTQARLARRDICSGWRSDGIMMAAVDRGRPLPLRRGPTAPRFDLDVTGGHHGAALPAGSMLRRRRIDVLAVRPDGTVPVDAVFRDTYVGADGVESIVHEYALHAQLGGPEGADLVVRAVDVDPRVLPWPECPLAAPSASRIVGMPVPDLDSRVRRELVGVETCTHLNDLLRSLTSVPAMLRQAAGP